MIVQIFFDRKWIESALNFHNQKNAVFWASFCDILKNIEKLSLIFWSPKQRQVVLLTSIRNSSAKIAKYHFF